MTRYLKWYGPRFTGRENHYLSRVIASEFVNDGPLTREFEQQLADLSEARFAVAVPNCTSAIALSLMAVGVGTGDSVIIPNLTFVATANAVKLCGAEPIVVDVEDSRLTIDVAAVDRVCSSNATVRAIVAVEVNGRESDYARLVEVSQKYGVPIISDSAEALASGGSCNKPIASAALVRCYSFSPNKLITTGQGGCIVTDDNEVHIRLKELKDQGRSVRGNGGNDDHPGTGYNFKFTDLQAAVGLAQLEDLDSRLKIVRRRQQNYIRSLKSLVDDNLLTTPNTLENEVCAWTDVWVDPENRDGLVNFLAGKGIETRCFWNQVSDNLRLCAASLTPVSQKWSAGGIWIPADWDVTEKDTIWIATEIRNYLENYC